MRELMALTRALADEGRVRILHALSAGELCVCQIVELLALAPSTVSKHLALLRQAGLVEARKDGRWIHYRLAEGGATVERALGLVREALADDPQARADEERLKRILRLGPEQLCVRQRESPLAERRARALAESPGTARARPRASASGVRATSKRGTR